jgi:putative transposase
MPDLSHKIWTSFRGAGYFLDKVEMATELDLTTESLNFELRHNSNYRYSKLGGKTPLKALEACQANLRFPDSEHAPQHRL